MAIPARRQLYRSFKDCLSHTNSLFGSVEKTFGRSYTRPEPKVLSDNGRHPAFRIYRNLAYITLIYMSHLDDLSNLHSDELIANRITKLKEKGMALWERYAKILEHSDSKTIRNINLARAHCRAVDKHIEKVNDFLSRNPRLREKYKEYGRTWENLAAEKYAGETLSAKSDLSSWGLPRQEHGVAGGKPAAKTKDDLARMMERIRRSKGKGG
jgi:hypothetical protein